MADALITAATEASVLVPEIWSQKWFEVLLAELPFNSLVNRDYEGEIVSLGDTVKISSLPEFDAAVVLSEDARSDASAITATQQSLVINSRVTKDFIVTNQALMQSLPFMDKMRDLAIYSINKKIQSLIVAATVPSTSSPDHAIAFDSGTTLALADILECKELLDLQDVPMSDRFMVMGAAQLNDLFNISGFMSSDYVTSTGGTQSGNIPPALLGFAPKWTTEVGNVVYFAHKSYLTLAIQKGLSIAEYDLGVDGKRARRVNCDVLMGLKQLDNTRVVKLG